MHQEAESCEVNIPERKSEEVHSKSKLEDSSPDEKFDSCRIGEKPPSPSSVRRLLPSLPSFEQTDERNAPRIPVNEMKKAQNKPKRILPYLPPVVQELLRWSIHPQQVLRGAASVSHLLTMPTIEEESLPNDLLSETMVQSEVPEVKRILPSIPTTDNRALPSKQPTPAGKPLPNFKAEFRKRMLPTLPTIREQTSPSFTEDEESRSGLQLEEKQAPLQPDVNNETKSVEKRKKKTVQKPKDKVTKSKQASLEPAEHASSVASEGEPKVKRTRPRILSADSKALLDLEKKESEELPRLRPKLARRSQSMFKPSVKNRLNSPSLNVKPVLPGIVTSEPLVPQPPSKPKPSVTRNRPTNQRKMKPWASSQEPMTPKPPSTPKPTVSRRRAMIQTTVNRPLPSIKPTGEAIIPKPPSSPKQTVTRQRPKIQEASNRQLPSIQPIRKQVLPSISSPSLQQLVKQPLSSIQLEEKYLSAGGTDQRNVQTKFEPLVMESQRGPQGNMRNDEQ